MPAASPFVMSSTLTTAFTLDHTVAERDIRRLCENAKRDQWNASRDLAWGTPADPDGRVIADELIDIYGSPLWERLGERDRIVLDRRIAAWRLSVLMYGGQGALLACSQMVDLVAGADQKFFQATQVMDEETFAVALFRMMAARARSRPRRDVPPHPAGRIAPHGVRHAGLARIGLLTERVQPRLTALGITLPAS